MTGRHDWDAISPCYMSRVQLDARCLIADAVREDPHYTGRHRAPECVCGATGPTHLFGCGIVTDALGIGQQPAVLGDVFGSWPTPRRSERAL